MKFASLETNSFRNLENVSLNFDHKFSVFSGNNASGKTSVMEALYYMAHARSFRSSNLRHLVRHGEDGFYLFASLNGPNGVVPLGLERTLSGKGRIKMGGQDLAGISEVAELLPLQFMDADVHRDFASGPIYRRKFLDWGVFHVEHGFRLVWLHYNKILRQRNQALKDGISLSELGAWDLLLVEYGEQVSCFRQEYLSAFLEVFYSIWESLSPGFMAPDICYSSGIKDDLVFAEALLSARSLDYRLGYTTQGPHRCDLILSKDKMPVYNYYSQGQQKALMFVLKVAQGVFLQQSRQKDVIYLIDDLPSELDSVRITAIIELLQQHASQVFLTCIKKNDIIDKLPGHETGHYFINKGNIIPKN
jgi:DNA replication and repair protein RecF